ncbi:DUF4192 domain-containing protein [Nocardioides rubriscoriae]|uniref:DUF4192 domain-containing protein n=1 Tax=Nocardioides rubriscoriae TaxID=642762 RepID=UPI0011DFA77F|nr:DUF4192 domain-containing protein [Nocardioides rubriscoriae]
MTPSTPPPTRLTARCPEDLLAASAVVLGFWPSESVVMLTFDAAHPFHARVDLPPEAAAMPALARTLVQPAAHHGVGRVVLMLHTAHPERARLAWRALRSAFAQHDIVVVEALRVGSDRWWPLLDDHGEDGVGVAFDAARLAVHPFLAQAVVDGRVLHRSRGDLAAALEPDPAAVARLAALVAGAPTHPPSVSTELAEGTWTHALVTRYLAAAAAPPSPVHPVHPAPPPTDAEVARLLCGMRSLRVRDAAWSAITRAAARPAVALFTDVLRRTPRELVPAPAALLAWAAWQAGDGALAWCALDRCEAVDPGYGLAALIAEALERAVPPTVMAEGFDWRDGLDATETG